MADASREPSPAGNPKSKREPGGMVNTSATLVNINEKSDVLLNLKTPQAKLRAIEVISASSKFQTQKQQNNP